MGVHRNEKKNVQLPCFFTTHEKFLYYFYVYMNIELRKLLHVDFYIVSETEKIHYRHLCLHNTRD